MINKFFSVTLNSFFRTLGRFLFYLLIAVLCYFGFKNFPVVHAANLENWGYSIPYQPTRAVLYNWTSSSNYTEVPAGEYIINNHLPTEYPVKIGFINNNNIVIANNGVDYAFFLNQNLSPDYLYNLTIYMCSTTSSGNLNIGTTGLSYPSIRTSSGYPQVLTEPMKYISVNSSALSNVPYQELQNSYNSCRQYSAILQPSVSSTWATIHLSSSSSISGKFVLMGYGLDNLGIASNTLVSAIDSIVKNSGFASANSVEEVQKSVDKVQQQLSGVQQEQQETNKQLGDLNDNLTSSDTSGAQDNANSFFDNFDDNDYGLSDVISMPLEVIKNITSTSCSPLTIPLPFVDTNLTLPCMVTIYRQFFGDILTIYQTITTGMIGYWVCINIFAMVKGFKDPDSDNVEVVEL